MDSQVFVTTLIVLAAVWHVGREIRNSFKVRKGATCGGCKACPSEDDSVKSPQLVTLEMNSSNNTRQVQT